MNLINDEYSYKEKIKKEIINFMCENIKMFKLIEYITTSSIYENVKNDDKIEYLKSVICLHFNLDNLINDEIKKIKNINIKICFYEKQKEIIKNILAIYIKNENYNHLNIFSQ